MDAELAAQRQWFANCGIYKSHLKAQAPCSGTRPGCCMFTGVPGNSALQGSLRSTAPTRPGCTVRNTNKAGHLTFSETGPRREGFPKNLSTFPSLCGPLLACTATESCPLCALVRQTVCILKVLQAAFPPALPTIIIVMLQVPPEVLCVFLQILRFDSQSNTRSPRTGTTALFYG